MAGLDDRDGRWPASPTPPTGASPFIFSIGAFDNDGTPNYQTPTDFGETNGDVPTSDLDFAWTNYGTGNLNTTEVDDIIQGGRDIDKTLTYGEYIGQHNNGNHTSLFQDVDTYLSGLDLPVAIVDNNGNFMGWATFHVISASGRLRQARQRLLPQLVHERPPDGLAVLEQRLPALSRVVRPEAHD